MAARPAVRTAPSRHRSFLLLYQFHHAGRRSSKAPGLVLPAQGFRMRTRRTRTMIRGGRSGSSNRSSNYYHHHHNGNHTGDNSKQSGFNSKTSSPTPFAILRRSCPRTIRLPCNPRSHLRGPLERRLPLALPVGCGGRARVGTNTCRHLHQLHSIFQIRFGAAVGIRELPIRRVARTLITLAS